MGKRIYDRILAVGIVGPLIPGSYWPRQVGNKRGLIDKGEGGFHITLVSDSHKLRSIYLLFLPVPYDGMKDKHKYAYNILFLCIGIDCASSRRMASHRYSFLG